MNYLSALWVKGLKGVFLLSILGSGIQLVLSPGEKIARRKIAYDIATRT